jgi:hypothetical protein
MTWQDMGSDGTMPERPGKPVTRHDKPFALYRLAKPLPPDSRPVMAQIGWVGQSGAVYALGDEPHDRREPGSYRPLYVQLGERVDAGGKWIIRE